MAYRSKSQLQQEYFDKFMKDSGELSREQLEAIFYPSGGPDLQESEAAPKEDGGDNWNLEDQLTESGPDEVHCVKLDEAGNIIDKTIMTKAAFDLLPDHKFYWKIAPPAELIEG